MSSCSCTLSVSVVGLMCKAQCHTLAQQQPYLLKCGVKCKTIEPTATREMLWCPINSVYFSFRMCMCQKGLWCLCILVPHNKMAVWIVQCAAGLLCCSGNVVGADRGHRPPGRDITVLSQWHNGSISWLSFHLLSSCGTSQTAGLKVEL